MSSVDTFGAKGSLEVGGSSYEIYRLAAVPGLERLPFSLKVLAENLLRTEDGANITAEHVRALAGWDPRWFQTFLGVLLLVALLASGVVRRRLKAVPRS